MYNAISLSKFHILRPSGSKHAPMKSTTVPMNQHTFLCQNTVKTLKPTIRTALYSLRRLKTTNFFVFSFVMVLRQWDLIIAVPCLGLMVRIWSTSIKVQVHSRITKTGILLAATAVDACGSLFPLAYAVVDAENDTNWLWFLECLQNVIQAYAIRHLLDNTLVFLSDRQKGLIEGVSTLFPSSPHGYCLRHLQENMHKSFKHPELK